jgi:hypothetical protein
MGDLKEVMYLKHINTEPFLITKVNKDEYIVHTTGEIKKYNHTETRNENKENLRRTFKKLRNLINYNFRGGQNVLAFTITYQENMMDVKRLYRDCDMFFKRLRYKYGSFDYISVVEPQGRGAWHCHILLKFNDMEKAYIPNKDVASLWGNGFVKVKAIKRNVDNLGAYLSAYLGDVEYTKESVKELQEEGLPLSAMEIKEVDVDGQKKKFIKGGRLHFYPTGMNIYRKSRGIQEPKAEYVKYAEVKKIVGYSEPNYRTSYQIYDDEGNEVNTIVYEQYNLKRAQVQCKEMEG